MDTGPATTSTRASTPVSIKVRRMKQKESSLRQSGPMPKMIQPTLGSYMVKRCGLVGSQRKAEGIKPSGPAKEPKGRDL